MSNLVQADAVQGRRGTLLLIGLVAAAALATVVVNSATPPFDTVGFTVDLSDITSKLTPLLLGAAFIERAVEVIITPWRDEGAAHLEARLAAAPDDAGVTRAYTTYKARSRRLAYGLAMLLGLCASVAGLRGLGSFVDGALPSGRQADWLRAVDLLLTAAVLAGGADGVHRLASLITDGLDVTRAKVNASAPESRKALAAAPVPPAAPADR